MTKLPHVTVTRTEVGGWLARCHTTGCRFRTIRIHRTHADLAARDHRAVCASKEKTA